MVKLVNLVKLGNLMKFVVNLVNFCQLCQPLCEGFKLLRSSYLRWLLVVVLVEIQDGVGRAVGRLSCDGGWTVGLRWAELNRLSPLPPSLWLRAAAAIGKERGRLRRVDRRRRFEVGGQLC